MYNLVCLDRNQYNDQILFAVIWLPRRTKLRLIIGWKFETKLMKFRDKIVIKHLNSIFIILWLTRKISKTIDYDEQLSIRVQYFPIEL